MEHNKKWYRRTWLWIAAVLGVLVVGGVVRGFTSVTPPEFSSSPVERIDLRQTVSETGSVVADVEIRYGWEVNGRVAALEKHVGDRVEAGNVIARLNSTKQEASLSQAQAVYLTAQARLNERLAPPSDEAVSESQAAVAKAQASLAQVKADLEKVKVAAQASTDSAQNALDSAYNDLQQASDVNQSRIVQDAYDDLLHTLQTTLPVMTSAFIESDAILGVDNELANDDFESVLSALNPSALNVASASYVFASAKAKAAQSAVAVLSDADSHAAVDQARAQISSALNSVFDHLVDVTAVLDATRPTGNLSVSELDAFKAGITTAKTSLNTQRTNVTNAVQAVTTAENSLTSYRLAYDRAVRDLDSAKQQAVADIQKAQAAVNVQQAAVLQAQAAHEVLVSVPRNVDVAALRAEVSNAAAQVRLAQTEFDKTRLTALSNGVIAKLDVELGENVTANQEVVTIISSEVNIDVDISESDIAKVQLGDPAVITLDAFGPEVEFTGTVASIEPSQTEISGVIYYATHVGLDASLEVDVRPGMTANVDILTDAKQQVLVIPQRAVFEEDGKKLVRVVTDAAKGVFERREIATGLRGDDGMIEVVSGLREGEMVVTFLKEE